ncbi:MAG: NADH dehydrogenase (quinone) subunit D [Actinobacteria bacterium]|nr:MAG: NADH dehydrogenase (quinone) subunit D [Actinomycetota bacterium]
MQTESETPKRQPAVTAEARDGNGPRKRRSRTTAVTSESTLRTETITLNLGPQHPSTHGVLHVRLELDGEVIKRAEPWIGYLHRGFEKLAERGWSKAIPLTDRLDYVAGWSNELGYVLAVEKLLGVEVPERARIIRVMLAEFIRITSHHIWYGTYGLDMGALTPILYAFREREQIYDMFEELSGARMMYNFLRFGGLYKDLPPGWAEKASDFIEKFPAAVDEYEGMLTENEIFRRRTIGIGALAPAEAIEFGVTGPVLRATGLKWDLRKEIPYSGYETYDFDIPTGTSGDCYDRYKVRIAEMRQSARIIKQCLERLEPGPVLTDDPRVAPPRRETAAQSLETLIQHFHHVTHGIEVPAGEAYHRVEGPRGELGFYVVSDGGPNPVRVKCRPPSFSNLQFLDEMSRGCLIADLIAIIGSLDTVLGEIDR